MQSQKILIPSDETQSPISVTISLDSLADYPEKLVTVRGRHSYLKGEYTSLRECKCSPYYDRTNTKHMRQSKRTVDVPYGFKTPLDFFESVTAEYLATRFHPYSEIEILSLGSGNLLREIFIIAKFIKELKKVSSRSQSPHIILHAIDHEYKKKSFLNSDEWSKTSTQLCIKQFKELINQLRLNVTLLTYSSIDEYNHQEHYHFHPRIILVIDVPLRFDSNFPLPDPKLCATDKKHTQEGVLEITKQNQKNGSIVITLTGIDLNHGMFIILEKKEDDQWKKEWLHTIYSKAKLFIAPPQVIQAILDEREKNFFLSDAGQFELEQIERFKSAPLSLAVKQRDKDTIEELLHHDKSIINAQTTDGFAALHWAAMRRDHRIISFLISNGADPNILNIHGRTPPDYYAHQISPEDFKDFIDAKFYKELCDKYSISADKIMPEFYEVYHYEEDINWAFGRTRNGFVSINPSIFHNIALKTSEELKASSQENRPPTANKKSDEKKNAPDTSPITETIQVSNLRKNQLLLFSETEKQENDPLGCEKMGLNSMPDRTTFVMDHTKEECAAKLKPIDNAHQRRNQNGRNKYLYARRNIQRSKIKSITSTGYGLNNSCKSATLAVHHEVPSVSLRMFNKPNKTNNNSHISISAKIDRDTP